MSSHPEIEAHKLMSAGRFADALPWAQAAVAGQRMCQPTHGMLATILLQLGRRDDAESVIARALECQQGPADAYDALAHVSALLGQHERSNALYRRTVDLAPKDPRFWHNLASSERSLGRLREAEDACDRAIALDQMRYATFQLRSELRVQTSDANHLDELRRELSRNSRDDRARMFLGYALAKELDDLKRYDEAFQHLRDASAIRRRHLSYDIAVDQRKLQRIQEVFQTAPLQQSPAQPSRHIFIVGLPRSGTTLLEHILMGLSGVRSNGETEHFSQALLSAAPRDRGDVFAGAAAADPASVAAKYEQLAGGATKGDRVIEKLPMNYLYLGAIHRAMPGAKLVLVNRHPVDSCFAMYRTLFGIAYPFSYDFDELAKYYAAYESLMAHWRALLGTALYEVTYEDLVADPAHVGAGVAAHCGLEWNDHAVEVHKRTTVSLTASAAQIRQPIYSSSSGRWRRYRAHLEPLIRALRREGISLREDV
ncbi:MAG TPA: sulfotransferase [Steroidobacter sp.]|uniref:tetratricopeptide repeat-containing sulfotransferase family protein n=1 Tax=Steroidobacter sp. TaxID=1978227 RepID=UPI002ED84F11